MIPKIAHSPFFGNWPLTELNDRCLESWKRVIPDWRIIRWTPHELTQFGNRQEQEWLQAAMRNPNQRHAGSNTLSLLRHLLLKEIGGVMLDTDIELLKAPPTDLPCYLGWQRTDDPDMAVNAAVFGSMPQHNFQDACIARILRLNPHCDPLDVGMRVINGELLARGLYGLNVEQDVGDIRIFSREKFYPWQWNESPKPERITPDTIAIHHWQGSWNK